MELKKLTFGIMALLLIGGAFAGVLDYYGKIEGTAEVEEPDLYPNSDGGLNLNNLGSEEFTIDSGKSHEFSYTLDSSKEFYPMKAEVYLDSSLGSVESVEFDYGNGSYFKCDYTENHWDCPSIDSIITVAEFRLKVTAGSGDSLKLNLGENTKVEVIKQ